MRKRRAIGLAFAALALIAPGAAVSQGGDTTDTFIKGTTDFLLDRANDNYVYVFQKKLESNPQLQKYLPETLRVVKAGDIQSLITHKDLWRSALQKDLIGDGNRLLTKARDEWKGYVDTLCKKPDKSPADGAATALDDYCTIAKAQLDAKVAEFLVNKWNVFLDKRCAQKSDPPASKESCDDAGKQMSTAQADLNNAGKVVADARKRIADAQSKSAGTSTDPDGRTLIYFSSPGAVSALSDLTKDLDSMKPEACLDLGVGRYTGCMIEILYILDAVSHADYVVNCYFYGNLCSNDNRYKNANRQESDDFADFRRYALFFAQLADAVNTTDRTQVSALLKSVTVPAVSFGIKREPHATRVLVTAYVGGGWSWKTGEPHQQVWGIVAPVGVEISQARDSGNSLSLLLSPLDFGYPLTLKMKNTDTTIKGSDVVVPAAYVFYGWKNYPFAAGVGYSRGRGVDNPDQRVGRVLVLVAFDLPLFRLR
jgi:hypothetical protein